MKWKEMKETIELKKWLEKGLKKCNKECQLCSEDEDYCGICEDDNGGTCYVLTEKSTVSL